MRIRGLLIGGAIGVAAAYFFHPEQGPGRRARLRDDLDRSFRQLQGLARGAAAQLGPAPEREDDLSVLRRVETILFAIPGYPRGSVELEVVDRHLVLRGEVPSEELAREAAAAGARVPGVATVRSELQAPAATS